uniref:Uncharacterized protein n=1 Tax=Oryza rufipogon TaxID=4529 RepID=A0A0E0QYP2_ORYRU
MQGGGRQRRLPGAAAAPPLTCSARSPGGSPRRGQRGSPVREQPLACGGLSSSAARPRWLLGVSGRAAGMPPRWPGEVRQPDNGGTGEWRRSGAAAPPAARWQCKGSWRRWVVFLVAGSTHQRGKLRLSKQCHPVPGSPSAKTGEVAGGW